MFPQHADKTLLSTLHNAISIGGYLVNIVRNTINNVDELPELDFGNNILDGIKAFILIFIYYIIPFIITLLVATLTGGLFAGIEILSVAFGAIENNVADLQTYLFNTIPQSTFETLFISIVITLIVGIILFIVFSIFSSIAFARFSKYESLSEGLNFGEVFNDIKTIGTGKVISWLILLIIVIIVIGLIVGILNLVPYIGIVLGFLLGQSLLEIIFYRSLGLLYREA